MSRRLIVGNPGRLHQRLSWGVLAVLASALFFSLSAVFTKYATQTGDAKAIHVTMARFAIGLLLTIPSIVRNRSVLIPVNWKWVIARALTNTAAAILFFVGIQLSNVSTANLLNMTFPILVFIISPFITRESIPWNRFGLMILMLIGVWLVVLPPGTEISEMKGTQLIGYALAFSSAIFAGFAMISLRMARRTDSSATVVFYLMAIGFIINLFLVAGSEPPTHEMLMTVIIAGLLGALGQFAITIGFRTMSASIGSLVSSSRIVFGSFFGILLFGDPLTVMVVIGTVLILSSLIVVSISNR